MNFICKAYSGIIAHGQTIEQVYRRIGWFPALPGAIVISGLTILYVWNGLRDLGLANDAFGAIRRAAGFPDHFEWVNGLYPLGYPILLRFAHQIFGDYRLAQHMLTAVAASITLIICYKIARLLNLQRATACLLVLMLGIAPSFIAQPTGMVTDMPQLMFLTLALWALLGDENQWRYFSAGLLLGLAYLVRYNPIYFMAATVIWTLLAQKWRASIWLLAGCLISSSPQWIASLILTGSPISISSGALVAVGLFMRENSVTSFWVGNASAFRNVSIFELISQHPIEIVTYWAENLRSIVLDPAKWTAPYLYLLVLPAVALAFLRSFQESKVRLLILWWTATVSAAAIPIGHISPRYLLPALLITYLFVVQMIEQWNVSRKLALGFLALLLLLEVRWYAMTGLTIAERRAPDVYMTASRILNQLNAFEPNMQTTVLDPGCGGGLFYNLHAPLKTPVAVTIVDSKERNNASAFKASIQRAGYRFVILDGCDYSGGLDWQKGDLPEGLRWVAIEKTFRILEIERD